MGRLNRILSNPSRYLSFSYIINNVIGGRLFILWLRVSPMIKSDRFYVKVFYRLGMGKKLNLDNPLTYTEKIHWLKLNNREPIYSRMVDKFQARELVKKTIGEEYLIPIFGVWKRFEDIDFANLPKEFVLKTTHNSGTVIICEDKSTFDQESARNTLTKSLKRNYYSKSREYPYRNAIPRIIAEKLLKTEANGKLTDYKFFCFSGKPKLLLVSTENGGKKYNSWLDTDFNSLPFSTGSPVPSYNFQKPVNFNKMLEIAEMLAQDILHIRIDLYNINGCIYFGEYTFHHAGGIIRFEPPVIDFEIGGLLDIGDLPIRRIKECLDARS